MFDGTLELKELLMAADRQDLVLGVYSPFPLVSNAETAAAAGGQLTEEQQRLCKAHGITPEQFLESAEQVKRRTAPPGRRADGRINQ